MLQNIAAILVIISVITISSTASLCPLYHHGRLMFKDFVVGVYKANDKVINNLVFPKANLRKQDRVSVYK